MSDPRAARAEEREEAREDDVDLDPRAARAGGQDTDEPDPLDSREAMRARSRAALRRTHGDAAGKGRGGASPGSEAQEPVAARGESENAYMTVRAYDDTGGLASMWAGPAYFHGALPTQYAGTRQKSSWKWTHQGERSADAQNLKVDSDRDGKSGIAVADWAPGAAVYITVDFRGLYGDGHIAVDAEQPLGVPGKLAPRAADGAEPVDLDAPGAVFGPLAPGDVRQSGDLTVEQYEDHVLFKTGNSWLQLTARDPEKQRYAFTVRAQTSPTQRVIDIVATPNIELLHENDPSSQQLVYHLQPQEDPAMVPKVDPDALYADPAATAEIQVVGDPYRAHIWMGDSHIHIERIHAESPFAYFVDPEWSGAHGEERIVHIVAAPGVKVDEFMTPASASAAYPAHLVANTMYVQDAALVPKQGTPIDPSQYLGIDAYAYGKLKDTGETLTASVATGNSGVTVRDSLYGLSVTLLAEDPTLGARFAWHMDTDTSDGPVTFRALVGPGVHVHEVELNEPLGMGRDLPHVAHEHLGIDVDIHATDDAEHVPSQGTVLTPEFLSRFPERAADSVSYKHELSDTERALPEIARFTGDMAIGAVPFAGDAVDLAELASGQDKWGNPLSTDERIVIGVLVALPFVGGAVMKGASRLAKGAKSIASAIEELVSRTGKTADELEAMLAHVGKLDPDAQAAARRVKQAVDLGGKVDPKDLAHVNDALESVGFRRAPGGGSLRAPEGGDIAKQIDVPNGVDVPGAIDDASLDVAAKDAPPKPKHEDLSAKEDELHRAVGEQYARQTEGKKPPMYTIQVVPVRKFEQRFGSEHGKAVFVVEGGEPVIYARYDAKPGDVGHEVDHLAQFAAPDTSAKVRFLDEENLSGWGEKSVSDQLEFYQEKLDLEIEAQRNAVATLTDPVEREQAAVNLKNLEALQEQVASITPEQLALMNAGKIARPPFLDKPPRLFATSNEIVGVKPMRTDIDGAADAGREVARTRGDPDYSTAYNDKKVTSVQQIGDAWSEQTIVTTGYDGKVAGIVTDEKGTTITIATKSGGSHSYVIETGAAIPDELRAPNASVKKGEALAREVPREHRWVRVKYEDGTALSRAEIKSIRGDQHWIQRGEESTFRGEQAELAAKGEVDAELVGRQKKGEISGHARISNKVGSGGFDDVIIEFLGEGDNVQARVRIREVKDYPNKHVPLGEFSAIDPDQNFGKNRDRLAADVRAAQTELKETGQPSAGFEGLGVEQLQAVLDELENGTFDVEIVLGPTTKLGDPGHHASKTLPELEGRLGRKVKVSRLGEGTP